LPLDEYPMLGLNVWLPARQDDPSRAYSFELAKLFFDGQADGVRGIASLDDVAPGSWRFVQVDLRTTRTSTDADPFGILLRQGQEDGKPVGLEVLVDDVTVFSPVDRAPGFEWGVPFDVSGIGGYSWAWDQQADTVPAPAVRTRDTTVTFSDVPAGHWVFHVRAVDGAGHWGPAAHLAIRTE